VRSAFSDAAGSLRIEMNAATDNPLIFPDGTSLSGGNFHAQGLAMALDHVALALSVLAGFSERRIARLVDTRLSELPPFLTKKSGLNSGMMIVQYVAAGLASDNKVLAHPASADSIPTSANQEDFVPMGMAAALKARQALENAARVVGLEVLTAAQGLEFLKPLRPGTGPRAAYAFVRTQVPPLDDDRSLAADADWILESMATGRFLGAVEKACGRLA
jgi:histidine ammonia-lyase